MPRNLNIIPINTIRKGTTKLKKGSALLSRP